MTTTIPHSTDKTSDRSVTTLTCPNCGESAQIVDELGDPEFDVMAEIEAWNEAHALCAEPAVTRIIEAFTEAMHIEDLAGQLLNTDRPHWSDPAEDLISKRPLWSQWRSAGTGLDDPNHDGNALLSLHLGQLVDQKAPQVVIRRGFTNNDGQRELERLMTLPLDTARRLAQALTLLADLAEGVHES